MLNYPRENRRFSKWNSSDPSYYDGSQQLSAIHDEPWGRRVCPITSYRYKSMAAFCKRITTHRYSRRPTLADCPTAVSAVNGSSFFTEPRLTHSLPLKTSAGRDSETLKGCKSLTGYLLPNHKNVCRSPCPLWTDFKSTMRLRLGCLQIVTVPRNKSFSEVSGKGFIYAHRIVLTHDGFAVGTA